MSCNDYLQVIYDTEHKRWKSANDCKKTLSRRSLGEAFLHTMRSLQPDKVLEYHYDEQKEKSVKDLYHESVMVAENLKRLHMQKGDVMLQFAGYNYCTSSLTFGCILMGGVVNFFEVNLDIAEMIKLFEIIQPFMILYEEVYLNKILSALKCYKPKTLKYLIAIDGTKGAASVNKELLKPWPNLNLATYQAVTITQPEQEIVFLVLTSGSTGVPKVTQLTHCLLLNGVYNWWANRFNYEPLDHNSILFSLSPLRWISQIALLLQSAILGIKRICANRAGTGAYGLEVIRSTKPTHLFAVPSFFFEVLQQLVEGDAESLESLKYIQLGGEPPSTVIRNLTRQFAVNSRLFYSYGMSETACSITNDEYTSGGKLQPGFEMQILDDNLQPLAHNQNGQLAIKTVYPFQGYRGNIKRDCYLENGYFLNGDFGYFDQDNNLHLLGRSQDLIRSGDILLIPILVETAVLSLKEVAAARLVGYRQAVDAHNEVAALFIILYKGSLISLEDMSTKIYQACCAILSKQQLSLIQDIYFEESFPLSTCGKVNRLALKDMALKKAELH